MKLTHPIGGNAADAAVAALKRVFRVWSAAFGGIRDSRYGVCEQGFAAVEFHTQMKTVYVGD